MANRLKKKVTPPPPPDPEQLVTDKVEQVTVKQVVKDERTSKIAGAISLLFTFFLFIAFTSYAFTWQEDQDVIYRLGVKVFSTDDVRVNNLLGVLGAYTAHTFIYNGFGIATFLFCTFFFVLGVNLLFGRKVFSLVRNLRYVVAGVLVLSVAFAFFAPATGFPWGGAAGDLVEAWMRKWIGKVGTGAVLVLAVVAYIIWRFNPVFRLPEFKKVLLPADDQPNLYAQKTATAPAPVVLDEEEAEEEVRMTYNEKLARGGVAEEENGKLFIEKPGDGNKLKESGKTITVLMPSTPVAAPVEEDPLTDFSLTEKEVTEELPGTAEEQEAMAPWQEEELMEQYIEEESEEPTEEPEPEPVFVQYPEPAYQTAPASTEPPVVKPAPTVARRPIVEIALEVNDTLPDMPLEIHTAAEEPADDFEEEAVPVLKSTPSPTLADPYDPALALSNYRFPTLDLLETHGSEKIVHDPEELEANKNQIITTLRNYDIEIQRISATVGPTVTLYEIVPAPGVRISRIKNLEDDIALSLAALGIRIIAPIPGKGTIGIEVPNVRKTVVSMRTLLASDKFQNNNFGLPIAIGKKIDNENFIVDLASMPHLLMAGATGQGKSVGINALLVSLLYKKHPSQLKFVMVDPKKVELSIYRVIEKHFLAKLPGEEEAIITDTKKVINTLNALCIEMDNRYDLLKEAGCRNLREYNEKFVKRRLNPQKGHQYLPFIVLVVDEFADLIMTAGKEVEMPIGRLAQLARAVGIHLIIATQRPSVNIITGTIKANFPARIAFKVSSKIDSRTILDAGGAEQLIGKGDMLINYNGEITRLQCAFVDTPEVDKICEYISEQQGYPEAHLLPEYVDEKELDKQLDTGERDPLFEEAARLIVQNQVGSTSLIQRRMKLGYNRAGRLMDQLESAGIVGKNLGSKARDVLISSEMELEEILGGF
jgi:S-DNA-T family DNA segregation ATPase FtsK/SpoIIIE